MEEVPNQSDQLRAHEERLEEYEKHLEQLEKQNEERNVQLKTIDNLLKTVDRKLCELFTNVEKVSKASAGGITNVLNMLGIKISPSKEKNSFNWQLNLDDAPANQGIITRLAVKQGEILKRLGPESKIITPDQMDIISPDGKKIG